MKYLCLAYEDELLFAEMPQDEWHALRQETLDYVERLCNVAVKLDTHISAGRQVSL